MWELDHKEGWALKNWCFLTVVLDKTLESPLDCKEFQPVHPKGNQSWIFIWRTDAEAETPILWPPDAKNWLIWKDPGAGKDWRQEEKGTTEDEMVGWHHRHNGHEFEQALGVGDGQGSLACCSPWGHKEWDRTERLNWILIYSRWWTISSPWLLSEKKWISGLRFSLYNSIQSNNNYCLILQNDLYILWEIEDLTFCLFFVLFWVFFVWFWLGEADDISKSPKFNQ